MHEGLLKALQEQVRFAHFGHDDLLDYVAALIGSAHAARIFQAFPLRTAHPVGLAIHGPVWSPSVAPSLYTGTCSGCDSGRRHRRNTRRRQRSSLATAQAAW